MKKTKVYIDEDGKVIAPNKIKTEYLKYRSWYEKQIRKGFELNARAELYYRDITRFAMRRDELAKEYHEEKKFKGTVLDEMKRRSFKAGTKEQVKCYHNMIKSGLKDLRESNPEEYEKIVQKYGDVENLDIDKVYFRELKKSTLHNNDDDTSRAVFLQIYYELKALGVDLHFPSP